MTQEEKSLLLKDLCARFIYGVIVRVHDVEHGDFNSYVDSISNAYIETHPVEELTMDFNSYIIYKLQEVKPYLRPMSSMTKEEGKELEKLFYKIDSPCWVDTTYGCVTFAGDNDFIDAETAEVYINWLNKKMFDYRGLIEKNLALEAPKDMYNIK